jgi:aromatic amino acid aminotransferase I
MSMVQREQIELEKQEGSKGNEAYIKALPPTYLTIDTDGRVIRMDVCHHYF